MFVKKALPYGLLLLYGFAKADVCPAGILHIEQTNVEIFPLYVSTWISANTVINIDGSNDAITINNAPTTVATLVNGTRTAITMITSTVSGSLLPAAFANNSAVAGLPSTSSPDTNTEASTASASAPTVSTIAEPILLQLILPNSISKRQATDGYLQISGSQASACLAANSYQLLNGSLENTDGTELFTTSPGIAYSPFVPSSVLGTITSGFTAQDGLLVWQNEGFDNGVARFCITQDSTIYAIFTGDGPGSCQTVTIAVTPSSTCPGYVQLNTSSLTTSASQSSLASAPSSAARPSSRTIGRQQTKTGTTSRRTIPSSSMPSSSATDPVYLASSIINSEGLIEFCTSYLGYSMPTAATTITTTDETGLNPTPATLTSVQYETVFTTTTALITATSNIQSTLTVLAKRQESSSPILGVPSDLTTFDSLVLSSACSLNAVQPTSVVMDTYTVVSTISSAPNINGPLETLTVTSTTTVPITIDVTTTVSNILVTTTAANIVQNPGFELQTADWTFSSGALVENGYVYDGAYSAQLLGRHTTTTTTTTYVQQSLTTVSGHSYTFGMYFRLDFGPYDANSFCTLAVYLGQTLVYSTTVNTRVTETGVHATSTTPFTATSAATLLNIQWYCSYGAIGSSTTFDQGNVIIDDVSVTRVV